MVVDDRYANVKLLQTADDVTPEIEKCIEECLDWFDNEARLSTEDFIDRLCNTYGGEDFDLDSYDNEAARKIMRIARQLRKERGE
jgi:hypothetical protein